MKLLSTKQVTGFSLAEALMGIGLAAVVILSIIAMTTAALGGDQKAEMRQIALAVADSEINRFTRAVAVKGNSARDAFWAAPDGAIGATSTYAGSGTVRSIKSNGTDFECFYEYQTLYDGSDTLGHEVPDNRVRKLNLQLTWWNGEEGKPGYGQLFLKTTRLIRESDIRENT